MAKRFLRLLIGTGVIVAAAYGYIQYQYPTISWNQKLTVVVDTPEGLKTGSSVTTRIAKFQMRVLPEMGGLTVTYRGEAVAVELQEDRYLFALLSRAGTTLPRKAFPEFKEKFMHETVGPYKQLDSRSFHRALRNAELSGVLPPELYPDLVTFTDIDDPLTAQLVTPSNISSIFGAGYSIKEIRLELTDESRSTPSLSSVLNWLSGLQGRLLDGTNTHRSNAEFPVANSFGSGNFSTETKQ